MPLTLTLSPRAGRGDCDVATCPFSPPAGRRWRQPDEGRMPAEKQSFPPHRGGVPLSASTSPTR
ncbi:hypothetical protein CO661_21205 [Sinorhizobium fredii]|uniref:Uncharacterized protein n=1 Tax=Rhizobium fredii TaxID=380 RepID=A0A2A6LTP8_RHIFR|nr:hypothetical protein CO661_21205 [Sinorhizobium fredii]